MGIFPSEKAYTPLLMSTKLLLVQTFGNGVDADNILVTQTDRDTAAEMYARPSEIANEALLGEDATIADEPPFSRKKNISKQFAYDPAVVRALREATANTSAMRAFSSLPVRC